MHDANQILLAFSATTVLFVLIVPRDLAMDAFHATPTVNDGYSRII